MNKKPVLLMILDGFGNGIHYNGNARDIAKMPFYNKLVAESRNAELEASGLAVGLPEGQMGNSEVGHMNIGAGRIMYQELTRITKAIHDGDFFENEVINSAYANVINNNSSLHLMGLLSDGGVHSHIEHLFALIKGAAEKGIKKIYVHCFMDGRDVAPNSGIDHIAALEKHMSEVGIGKIATVSGRYYAMDRDKRWERVNLAYDAIVNGVGKRECSAKDAVAKSYASDVYDEFIIPTVIAGDNDEVAQLKSEDSVIFFNFRPDRARELTRAILDESFNEFERKSIIPYYVCMTQYDDTIPNTKIAYVNTQPINTLGEFVSKSGKTQLRIAETEKYAHVTFFFNGGRELPFEGEDRILVASPKVATYDLMPEMSAVEVTDNVVGAIEAEKYDLIVLNFANPDMVGHTGSIPAVVKALEVIDGCVERVINALLSVGGTALITADHGNCEMMVDNNGNPVTSHTTNLVPLTLIGSSRNLQDGKLCDLAPTILDLMGMDKPSEMTGKSLLI